ncbi:MAG: HemK family protein methyltransferase [Candidatus Pacebacteria bacterium]|nr:HemK family protein methyltransferase [Candidatus Paceibacterota bacterium]
MTFSVRRWLPYEKNYLLKYNFDLKNLDQYGLMPVEYIVGIAEFMNYQFKVNSKVLIPRIESEKLIKLALSEIKFKLEDTHSVTVADIGTGSGVLGLTLLLELNKDYDLSQFDIELTLSDISKEALTAAQDNYQRLFNPQLKKITKVTFLQSDLLRNYDQDKEFDLILANLPYIPTEELDDLDCSVKDYEPVLALDGGEDGLVLVRKLITQLDSRLKKDGVILLEVSSQVNLDRASLGLTQKMEFRVIEDQHQRQRFVKIKFS